MSPERFSRREALCAAACGLAALASAQSAQAQAKTLPLLDPASPTAKQFGYIDDASKVDVKANPMYRKGQLCSNCYQWDEKTAVPVGKCKIFPNNTVKGPGWCKVYVPKPAPAKK